MLSDTPGPVHRDRAAPRRDLRRDGRRRATRLRPPARRLFTLVARGVVRCRRRERTARHARARRGWPPAARCSSTRAVIRELLCGHIMCVWLDRHHLGLPRIQIYCKAVPLVAFPLGPFAPLPALPRKTGMMARSPGSWALGAGLPGPCRAGRAGAGTVPAGRRAQETHAAEKTFFALRRFICCLVRYARKLVGPEVSEPLQCPPHSQLSMQPRPRPRLMIDGRWTFLPSRRRSDRVRAHVLQVVQPALQARLVCRLEVHLGRAAREGVEREAQRLGRGQQEDVRPACLRGVEVREGDRTTKWDGHLVAYAYIDIVGWGRATRARACA